MIRQVCIMLTEHLSRLKLSSSGVASSITAVWSRSAPWAVAQRGSSTLRSPARTGSHNVSTGLLTGSTVKTETLMLFTVIHNKYVALLVPMHTSCSTLNHEASFHSYAVFCSWVLVKKKPHLLTLTEHSPPQVKVSPFVTSYSVCATKPLRSACQRLTLTTVCRRSCVADLGPPAAGPAGLPNHDFPLSPVRRARSHREETLTWVNCITRNQVVYRTNQWSPTRIHHKLKTGERRLLEYWNKKKSVCFTMKC